MSDFGPGRRGGYPPRLPQIRACALNAPGSSRCGRSLSLTRLGRFAVTRWRRTVSSAWFQLPVHNAAPPSLHGVRKGRSPASSLLWSTATSCPSSRGASFPSLGDTLERLRFVPARPQTQGRRIIPEFAVPVAPGPVFFKELSGSPKFLVIVHPLSQSFGGGHPWSYKSHTFTSTDCFTFRRRHF